MSNSRTEVFVNYIIENVSRGKDKGFGAKMRNSDNDATEYQAWEILAKWVDLEKRGERRVFALIGASLARLKPSADGSLSIGGALRQAYFLDSSSTDLDKSSTALRFNRILACRDQEEIINILRPTLRYIESKNLLLDYSQLLNEILWFNNESSRERTRARWAQHFYKKGDES